MVCRHLVPHNAMSPQLIGPSWQTVPNQFGPHGQVVPKNPVPMDKWSQTNLVFLNRQMVPRIFCLSKGQAVGIQKYRDRIGWGPFLYGDNFCGRIIVQWNLFYGNHLSRGKSGDQMALGPNVSQPCFVLPTMQSLGNYNEWVTSEPYIHKN